MRDKMPGDEFLFYRRIGGKRSIKDSKPVLVRIDKLVFMLIHNLGINGFSFPSLHCSRNRKEPGKKLSGPCPYPYSLIVSQLTMDQATLKV
jgi:hypothetical protein